ncbi:MAG: hypothetical protein HY200_00615 [Nitrospirae bacterium]|nr:hypothetical protein [Nitrospirota bacterium]MBI3593440.1 hypothetical protein [Nitrospirota bacterium]
MSYRFKVLFAFFLFLISGFSELSSAQSYRDLGNLSLNDTFEKLLDYSKQNDFEGIEKSIQLLTPLKQSLESKYSKKNERALQSAIDQKEGEKALLAIQQLIYLDMKDQLLTGIDSVSHSKERAITKFKYAYLDYLLLSPYLQSKSFNGEQKIRNLFRKFAMSVNKTDQLMALNQEIEKEMLNTFPTLQ